LGENILKQVSREESETLSDKVSLLKHIAQVRVRFNEADPLGIVWHGHYIRFMEDGREEFGRKYGVSYLDFYNNGLVVPVVSVNCDFKSPLRYGDIMDVEVTYHNTQSAKIYFEYLIRHSKKGNIVAKGSSTQVFVNHKTFDLHLTVPAFFEEWKKKMNLI